LLHSDGRRAVARSPPPPRPRLAHSPLPFFSPHPPPPSLYPLSLHDALPISLGQLRAVANGRSGRGRWRLLGLRAGRRDHADNARDRKSTRLNSSHVSISYAVFCLKKNKHNSHAPSQRS